MIKTKNDTLNIISFPRFKVTNEQILRFGCCIFTAFAITFSGINFSFADTPKEPKAPIAIKAEVDKHSVAIGDKIKYTIAVFCAKNIEVEFPDFGKNLENFAIKDFASSRKTFFGKQRITTWYLLDTYVTGESIIPKAVIKYRRSGQKDWNQAEIPEQKITVKSMLEKAGPNAILRDIKNPVNLPQKINRYFIMAMLILAVILILSAVFLLKTKNTPGLSSLKPAHEIAYEQLAALRKKDLIGQGKIKEFYIEISDITRHYIENRFNIKAPEMTTEEFFIKVKVHPQFKAGHKTLLKEFLLCCDLVKFAKYTPLTPEIDSTFESAEKFIGQTKEEQKTLTNTKVLIKVSS